MNPQYMAGPTPAFNNNPPQPSGGLPFMPPPLNGVPPPLNANQLNANITHKMQGLSLDQGQQQNGPFSNGPMGQYQQSPRQLPPTQMPPGQMPPAQMPLSQMPPAQMPPRQMPITQMPSGQIPPGQLPPGQMPPSQIPPRQMTPGQMPPGQMPLPSSMPPSQLPPSSSPAQLPPSSMAPGQLPPSSMAPGQLHPGHMPPSQMPPGQAPPGQMYPSELSESQAAPPRTQTPVGSNSFMQPGQGSPLKPGNAQPGLTPPMLPSNIPQQVPSQNMPPQRPSSNFSAQLPPSSTPGSLPSSNQQMSLPPTSQGMANQQGQQRMIPPGQSRPNYPPMPATSQSIGMPSNQMGMPPNQTGMAPNPMNMPPNQMGMQQNQMGMPLNQMGMSSNQMGMPSNQMGMPPNQMGMPPNQMGMPPTQMGMPPSQIGMPPTSQSSMGVPMNGSQGNQFQAPQGQFSQGVKPKPGMPPLPGQKTPMMPPLPGQQQFQQPNTQNPGFPGQQSGFPGQQPGFPAQQPGYPGQQPSFPNQQPGFQGQQAGFAGQQQPPMPGQQPGYPGQPVGYPGQQAQYGYQQQTQKRLNPDQMPSPIQVMMDDQNNNGGVFVTNQKGLVPPLVTTDFTVEDQGNASPRYIRSSMYSVPATPDMIKQTAVPFCVVVSPLAETVGQERPPPLLDIAQLTGIPGMGPVRCSRCKAYLCPAMRFLDAGRHFQCAFCKATTEVPMEYTQYLNNGQHYGQTSPEMSLGCYEIVATKEYCRNNVLPTPPALIFVLDVSYNAVRSGLVQLVMAQLKALVADLPPMQRIGIITYGSTVHFYNINETLASPQMLVVGDVQEVFVPLSHGLLVEPSKAEHLLDALAERIPTMFADNKETEPVLLPAVRAGLEALKAAECCGKLLIFHSSLPTAQAPGRLINRDDRKLLGTDKEKSILTPQTKAYNEVAQDCVAAGCGIELFLFNSSYVDAATLGQLPRLTGGSLYKYTYFQADVDGERFLWDLRHVLKRPTAYDAVMRVRTSTGVRATDFYGHFFMSNTTDVELATLDSDKGIGVEIKHDDKLTGEDGVYIQVALLYTHVTGQRRLRICNLALNVATQMADVYRCCDLDTIINFLTKQAVWRLSEHPSKSIKEGIIARCAQSLVCYRKHCASPTSAGQLVLPESMKLLPLYANCLIRSDALSGGSDMACDDRSWAMSAALSADVSGGLALLYPQLMDLAPLLQGEPPQPLRCTADKLTPNSVYLLENGVHMLLWIGLQTPADMMRQLLGANSVQEMDVETPRLHTLPDPANQALHQLLHTLRTQRCRFMRLTLVRQNDKLETVFRHFLVEDAGANGAASYVDFLCHVHKEIRALL